MQYSIRLKMKRYNKLLDAYLLIDSIDLSNVDKKRKLKKIISEELKNIDKNIISHIKNNCADFHDIVK